MKRSFLAAVAAAAILSACSESAPTAEEAAATTEPAVGHETPDPVPAAVREAVNARLVADLGKPAMLDVTTLDIDGEWAWVVGKPVAAEGTAFDYTGTKYESAIEHGAFDAGGAAYALVKREGDGWRVVEFIVGPTDVAWEDWPARHGAPRALLGLSED